MSSKRDPRARLSRQLLPRGFQDLPESSQKRLPRAPKRLPGGPKGRSQKNTAPASATTAPSSKRRARARSARASAHARLQRPGGVQERSKRPTGGENKGPEDRTIAKRPPRWLQEGSKTHFGAILGRILEPSRDEFGTIWGPVGELFLYMFSFKQAAEHIKRTIKTGASRSASPALSGRARVRVSRRAC